MHFIGLEIGNVVPKLRPIPNSLSNHLTREAHYPKMGKVEMESIPLFLTYLYLCIVGAGVVIGFVISLPMVITGIVMFVLQKRSVIEDNQAKSRTSLILIVLGTLMFFVLGYKIIDFLREIL